VFAIFVEFGVAHNFAQVFKVCDFAIALFAFCHINALLKEFQCIGVSLEHNLITFRA
jgi:hypothetical protein